MTTVAFVGLGRMGRLMTPHLVRAGHQVRGFDLDPEAVVEGVRGARVRAQQRAGRRSRSRCSLLPRPVRSATLGEDGIAEGLEPGALCIDMSTAPPALARELAEALARGGVDALDAPVSGGTIGAKAGTLTIMVGGPAAVAERAQPLFEALGTRVVHVGAHGLGQAAKLCNNLCAGINMAAIAQSLALARREGLDARRPV